MQAPSPSGGGGGQSYSTAVINQLPYPIQLSDHSIYCPDILLINHYLRPVHLKLNNIKPRIIPFSLGVSYICNVLYLFAVNRLNNNPSQLLIALVNLGRQDITQNNNITTLF